MLYHTQVQNLIPGHVGEKSTSHKNVPVHMQAFFLQIKVKFGLKAFWLKWNMFRQRKPVLLKYANGSVWKFSCQWEMWSHLYFFLLGWNQFKRVKFFGWNSPIRDYFRSQLDATFCWIFKTWCKKLTFAMYIFEGHSGPILTNSTVWKAVPVLICSSSGFKMCFFPCHQQSDQIGRIFAYWVTVNFGQFFENYRSM
jgi:hypothetical protein